MLTEILISALIAVFVMVGGLFVLLLIGAVIETCEEIQASLAGLVVFFLILIVLTLCILGQRNQANAYDFPPETEIEYTSSGWLQDGSFWLDPAVNTLDAPEGTVVWSPWTPEHENDLLINERRLK